ncbi:DUF1990 domain-containing protein [Paractinoplanes durhamensis]|uniref:DUF1990 domain-containing protein n=1 Tax=Paractinoplanes durhamensis TaxID=113563 RepID=A0ABQ3YWZ2_9ACTN|nr:DUF1990 domain-containing protein [Actinoplanes durhamensis]
MTYSPVGGTRTSERPPGFRHLFFRMPLGTGASRYAQAGAHILSFRMHRATGAKIVASAATAAPGVQLTVGLGPLRAPCEIVWAEKSEKRTGWGYGTRPGHPASGEEAFFVEHDERDRVWFTVVAYSRPASLLMRLGGPFAVGFQHLYARLCGRALKRLCTVNS